MKRLILTLFQLCLIAGMQLTGQTVDNVLDLQDAINNVSDGGTITLSSSFPKENATAIALQVNHSNNFTINGGGEEYKVTADVRFFTINKTASGSTGSLTLDGFHFVGRRLPSSGTASGLGGGGVVISNNSYGTIQFINSSFNSISGVGLVAGNSTCTVVLKKTTFINNWGFGHGGGLYVAGKTNVIIDYCTFDKNYGDMNGGYSGGAMCFEGYTTGVAKISNCVFTNNVANEWGGAIGVYAPVGGSVSIDACYFAYNSTIRTNNGNGDGGAIGIHGGNANTHYAKFYLSNSTFYRNKASDDGGAVYVQNPAAGAESSIVNCTMFENESNDVNPATTVQLGMTFNVATSGGAVQVSLPTPITMENNTIIRNYTTSSYQRGGGIGAHANSDGAPKFTLRNNIILGNYIKSGVNEITNSYANIGKHSIFNPSYSVNVGNIGFDNGSNLASNITIKNTFGRDDVVLHGNHVQDNAANKVGNPNELNTDYYRIIPSISIIPNDNEFTFGLADGKSVTNSLTSDQRGYARSTSKPDVGSVEIFWARFNANGGIWTGLGENAYIGDDYYTLTDSKTSYYYKVSYSGGKVTSPTTATDKLVHPDGKVFVKWVTDDEYETDWNSNTPVTADLKLKAIWKDGALDIIYHSNFGTDQTFTASASDGNVTVATYPATSLPNRLNYIFLKWTTKADGTGTAYLPGATFTITENTDLYARWEPNSALKLQWSVSKTTADPYEFSDVENNSTTTVMVGTPVYVQIRPIGLEHVDFDTWAIEYIATPTDYHYPMGEAIGKTLRYDFNKGEAHTLEGTYYYNVTKLLLYKGGVEVAAYIYRNASCTHKVVIQDEPVVKDPALQWSVSTVTSEQPYFKDVDDQSTTSVNYGTPVFVQIRPVGHEGINFERWAVEYTVTPAEHYYGMNATLKTERHNFNNREAHTEKGTYIYTVTKLTLYDMYGNQTIETYDYADSPYRHTIVIGDGEGPGPGPGGALQWSVSTASNKLEDFRDVDNLTTTTVTKGTPVYVQIRPVGFNNVTYDRWEIEYTATPAGYHYPLDEAVLKTERYTFNKGEAHTLVGTYIYNVHKLTLYNGESIASEQYYNQPAYRHTIVITDEGMIHVGETAPYCSVDGEFRIPVSVLNPDYPIEYAVRFTDEAIAAGFSDTEYKDLTPGYITVPVSNRIPRGIYHANIYVRLKSDPDREEAYPFNIEVLETTTITRQPQSVNVCDGDAFTLSVEATGVNLSYQWFFNEVAIPGATSDSYTAALTPDKEGIYYVDVYGDCGMESSRTVTVGKNGLRILVKWNEFLYITNQDNEFVRFQWYKDGQKIDKNGTSIYYSVAEGLLGTYFIQAYRADDTYVVSCPITFETLTQFQSTRVYPTMVNKNTPITIQTGAPDETPESAVVEVYNLNGQIVNRLEMKTWETTLSTDMASGSYIVKVTTESGRTTTHKIIIK